MQNEEINKEVAKQGYITIAEASKLANVNFSTVWRWVKKGEVSVFTVGNVDYLSKDEILQRKKQRIPRGHITIAEAARRVGNSRTFIYNLIMAGIVPGEKLNGTWYLPVGRLAAHYKAVPALKARILYGDGEEEK